MVIIYCKASQLIPFTGFILVKQQVYMYDEQTRLIMGGILWSTATKISEDHTGGTDFQSYNDLKFNCIDNFCSTL